MYPAGAAESNGDLACRCEAQTAICFHGHLPLFTHSRDEVASFRMFTGQLIVQGRATQGRIQKAFGVPLVAIKRPTKLYRTRGAAGFLRRSRGVKARS